MRYVLAIIVCLSIMSGARLEAQTIALRPGEKVTVLLDEGRVTEVSRQRAQPMTEFEIYMLYRAQGEIVPPGAKAVPATPIYDSELPTAITKTFPQRLELTLRLVPGRGAEQHSALTIANGYKGGLRYSAVLQSKGRAAPTDVCEVMPEREGLEHWPYPIEQLDLSDFRLEPWVGGQLPCS